MADRTNKEWKTEMYTFMMQNKIYNRNTIFATNVAEGCFRLKKLLSERSYDIHTAVMMHIPPL